MNWTKQFRVRNRVDLGYSIKPNALQLEGKVFTFMRGWVVDDIERYMGENVWVPVDANYPKDAPAWIAEGDLVDV